MMIKAKNDLPTKITILIIAIFLWIFVMDKENPEQTNRIKNVPISFTNQAYLERNGLVIVEPESASVTIDVTGKKRDLNELLRSDIIATVDLGGYSEGQVKIPIKVELANQSTGLRITNFEPRDVFFTFDKLITKEMHISIETTGQLPDNYVTGDVVTKQQSVLLNGPRTAINSIQNVIALVDLTDKTSLFNVSVPMTVVDHNGENVIEVSYEPRLVDVTIPVYRTKELPIEINLVNSLPENLILKKIELSSTTVIVKGNDDVQNLNVIQTMPIDVQSLIGQTSLEVELKLPEGVQLLDLNKKIKMNYLIEEVVTKEYTLDMENFHILNLGEGLRLSGDYKDNYMIVTLKGEKTFLDKLESQDIAVSIDLKGLTQGRHDVNISINKINNVDVGNLEDISIESINPHFVPINIISTVD